MTADQHHEDGAVALSIAPPPWRRLASIGAEFLRSRLATGGLILVAIMVGAAALAPLLSAYAPEAMDYTAILQPPSWAHLFGTECTIESYAQRPGVHDTDPECFYGLSAQGAAAGIGDGAGNDDGDVYFSFVAKLLYRKEGGFGIEGLEDGLYEQYIGTAIEQAAALLVVYIGHFAESDSAVTGAVHIRRNGKRTISRADRSGYKARPGGVAFGKFIRYGTCKPGTGQINVVYVITYTIISLSDTGGTKGISFYNIGPGFQILSGYGLDNIGPGKVEQIVIAFQVAWPVGESLAAIVLFGKLPGLDQAAHRSVDYQDAFGHQLTQCMHSIRTRLLLNSL